MDLSNVIQEHLSSIIENTLLLLEPKILNSIGLGFDIIGFILIFFFGLPNRPSDAKGGFIALENYDPGNEKLYRFWSKIGFFIIIFGFILQIISNLI